MAASATSRSSVRNSTASSVLILVDRDTPGFSTNRIKNKFSLRASVTSELVFEDCKVPKENLLPGVEGLKGPLSCLTSARFGIAFGAVGAAMAVYDEAVRYSKNRIMFDRPIARFQLVQNKLVWILNEITKGQLLAWRLAKLKESWQAAPHPCLPGEAQQLLDGPREPAASRATSWARTASPTSTR